MRLGEPPRRPQVGAGGLVVGAEGGVVAGGGQGHSGYEAAADGAVKGCPFRFGRPARIAREALAVREFRWLCKDSGDGSADGETEDSESYHCFNFIFLTITIRTLSSVEVVYFVVGLMVFILNESIDERS